MLRAAFNSTQPATVGQLDLFGLGQVNITGSVLLIFDRPGSDPALLQTVPSSGVGVAGSISNPISFSASEQLSIVVGTQTSLALNGAIGATAGDITKSRSGSLSLGMANTGWAGRLFIIGGSVDVLNSAGLGTTNGLPVSRTHRFGGTVLALRKLVSPLNVRSGDRSRRRNSSSNQGIRNFGRSDLSTAINPMTCRPMYGLGSVGIIERYDRRHETLAPEKLC